MYKRLVVIALMITFSLTARSQSVADQIGTVVLQTILPSGYEEGLEMRLLLRSNQWKKYKEQIADTTAMNMIYELSYALCNGRSKRALLASGVAVLDHRSIPLRLPFGLVLNIPLTLESETHFQERTSALPTYLYSATREDRDKLQHFFFSAYLKRVIGMSLFCRLVGNMTEVLEDAVVIGGANDNRDKHANADGVSFGLRSLEDKTALPSESLSRNP